MSRWLCAMLVIPLAIGGCKGKLPKSLIAPKPIRPGSYTMIALGMAAPTFDGEMVYGLDPKLSEKPGNLYVISTYLALKDTPTFFYHTKLYPDVRWVQFIQPGQANSCLKRIEELKRQGEPTEGLTVYEFDLAKNPMYWAHRDGIGEYVILKGGVVYAYAFQKDLDHTISAILSGKYDPKAVATAWVQEQKQWKDFDVKWLAIDKPFFEGQISFSQLTKRAVELYPTFDNKRRSQLLGNFLYLSECRPKSEVEPMLAKVNLADDSVSPKLVHDILKHEGHFECRDRMRREFDIAIKGKSLDLDPEACQHLAEIGIALDRKKDAIKVLNLMKNSPTFKPRYAKIWRESMLGDYDNLMWRATH